MTQTIRVLILDDHAEVRQALRQRLDYAPDIHVVGDVGDAEQALATVSSLKPDVVLMESKRSDGRGLELIHWIAQNYPASLIIVLTSYPTEWECWAARRAGARQYLLKDIGSAELVEHIRQAVADQARWPPQPATGRL
ncbi:MAG: response regulator transcription factor [Anaerolineales bacterium]|nr:response regulator transcription factor [Anaerolineales bacterium]